MFFRKLIVILLLGFYGIPAAIGPHWHHHRCTDQACISHLTSVTDHAVQVKPEATSHVCSCHHHGSMRLASKQATQPPAWTEPCGQHDGPCAICAFYASAQALPVAFEFGTQHELVFLAEQLEPVAPSVSRLTGQARGPPVA